MHAQLRWEAGRRADSPTRAAWGLSGVLGTYLVLGADWGPRDRPHVFTPIRAKAKAALTATFGPGTDRRRPSPSPSEG